MQEVQEAPKQEAVMGWVERLPEVGDPIRRMRQAIEDRLKEAGRLESQARAVRAQAYFDGLALEAKVRALWSEADINRAKQA
jgi:hypothetical protein